MIKTAVILAAGRGTRIQNIINDKPKGFIEMSQGRPIIEESISKLLDLGIERIFIGTGHLASFYEKISNNFPQVKCINNPLYAESGSMYTMFKIKDKIQEDFLLLESDIIYEKRGIKELLADEHKNTILASGRTDLGDEVFIEVDKNKQLIKMSKNINTLNDVYGELVGISKISIEALQLMCEFSINKQNLDYEDAIMGICHVTPFFVKKLNNFLWCEIDDEHQLECAISDIYPKIKLHEKH